MSPLPLTWGQICLRGFCNAGKGMLSFSEIMEKMYDEQGLMMSFLWLVLGGSSSFTECRICWRFSPCLWSWGSEALSQTDPCSLSYSQRRRTHTLWALHLVWKNTPTNHVCSCVLHLVMRFINDLLGGGKQAAGLGLCRFLCTDTLSAAALCQGTGKVVGWKSKHFTRCLTAGLPGWTDSSFTSKELGLVSVTEGIMLKGLLIPWEAVQSLGISLLNHAGSFFHKIGLVQGFLFVCLLFKWDYFSV